MEKARTTQNLVLGYPKSSAVDTVERIPLEYVQLEMRAPPKGGLW